MNRKLQEIFRKNAEFEREAPYNFCDRWCERCIHEKQVSCKLYQDEFERKITCIAHGREPDDPEITTEVMKKQYEDLEGRLEKIAEETDVDFDDIESPGFEKIKEHIEFVENNSLRDTAEQYHKKSHLFLENTFYKKEAVKPELVYDFETVTWYHTLLPVKLHRALCGFHEPVCENEFALYDAVAQFQICKKAIKESIKALRTINQHFPSRHIQILELLALLNNIHSRIEAMEESL